MAKTRFKYVIFWWIVVTCLTILAKGFDRSLMPTLLLMQFVYWGLFFPVIIMVFRRIDDKAMDVIMAQREARQQNEE